MKYAEIITQDKSTLGIYERMMEQLIKHVKNCGGWAVTEYSILFEPAHSRVALIKLEDYIGGTKTLSEKVAIAIKAFIRSENKYLHRIKPNTSTEQL
jgi:histidinol dehydrogenase